jgi:hypothetical protein
MAINPLQQPINYFGAMPEVDIGKQFAEFGQALAERQKRSQAEEVKAAYKTDLQAVLDNPSMKAFNEFSLKYPQQREVIKDVASRFTQEQQDSEFNIGRDVAVALENDKPEVALEILNQTIDAREKSKLPVGVYGQVQQILLNTDDPDRLKKAKAQTNFALTLLNPERFSKAVDSLAKQKLDPEALREQTAKADKAVQDAKNAVDTAPDEVAKAAALRKLEEEKAKQEAIKTEIADATQAAAQAKIIADSDKARGDADKAVADATTAQATAANATEKAAADAKLATAQAAKAAVEAKYADQLAALGIRKTESDITIAKENARIAALNATLTRETNNLKRQELQQKIDESKEKRDAADREQKASLVTQTADIDNFLNTATRVINTPRNIIESATGPVASRLPTLSADVADFESLVETLGSQAFIAQIPKIKGTGNLTEKEGDKLQASLQNLSLKQSPDRLIENVKEAMRLLEKSRTNITARSGLTPIAKDVPAATEATVSLPNGQTLKFPNRAAADAFKKKAGL